MRGAVPSRCVVDGPASVTVSKCAAPRIDPGRFAGLLLQGKVL